MNIIFLSFKPTISLCTFPMHNYLYTSVYYQLYYDQNQLDIIQLNYEIQNILIKCVAGAKENRSEDARNINEINIIIFKIGNIN